MLLLLLLFCIGATKDDEHHDDDNVDMAGSTPSLLPFHFHHCDCDWHTFSRAALPFPPFLLLSSSLCFFLAFRSLSLSFPLMSIYTCVPVVLSKKGASVVYLLHITYTRIFQCPIASTKIYKKKSCVLETSNVLHRISFYCTRHPTRNTYNVDVSPIAHLLSE